MPASSLPGVNPALQMLCIRRASNPHPLMSSSTAFVRVFSVSPFHACYGIASWFHALPKRILLLCRAWAPRTHFLSGSPSSSASLRLFLLAFISPIHLQPRKVPFDLKESPSRENIGAIRLESAPLLLSFPSDASVVSWKHHAIIYSW